MIVEPDDRAVQAHQVARADAFGYADDVPNVQRRQRRDGANGEQELPTRLHRRGERAEMVIQLARRDGVQQRPLVLEARPHAAAVNPSLPAEALSVRITAIGSSCGPAT